MLLTASYLARCALRGPACRTRPPEVSGRLIWNDACDSFFEAVDGGRTPGQFRHTLQARCNVNALLDNSRARRNKGTRQQPALCARIHEEWTDREDTELELLVLTFRAGASGERHEER